MSPRHVIVDGSNLATEGRSMPSLAQLDQAVREFIAENPQDVVTVVVDASFGHRIDPSEVPAFDAAEAAGEVVSPPAGAIGRGDAFLLRIAEKTGATVLSNDSFQEFHVEHSWLFDKGRLIGGKPVPGVGWIFMERNPVRGHKSREAAKEAKRHKRGEAETLDLAAVTPADGDQVGGLDAASAKSKGRPKSVDRAIARATQEVVEPKSGRKGRRRRGGEPPSEPVNEPLAFITFIAAHPLGSEVVGTLAEYSSHGGFVQADGARCYIPLSAMGDPPPRRTREALAKGEERVFVVQAFDPQRRGIELALPGFAHIAGGPTAETVEAEIASEPAGKTKRRGAGEPAPDATADGATRKRKKEREPAEPLPSPAKEKVTKAAKAKAAETAVAKRAPAKAATKATAKTTTKVASKASKAAAKAPAATSPAKATGSAAKAPSKTSGKVAAPPKVAATPKKTAAKKSTAKKADAPAGAGAAEKSAVQKAVAAKKTQPAKRATAAAKPHVTAPAPKKAARPSKAAGQEVPSRAG